MDNEIKRQREEHLADTSGPQKNDADKPQKKDADKPIIDGSKAAKQ